MAYEILRRAPATCPRASWGYLHLSEQLASTTDPDLFSSAFNFGPQLESNRTVRSLLKSLFFTGLALGRIRAIPSPHEANLLNLVIDKAHRQLRWGPRWSFSTTVERTVRWYRQVRGWG